MVKNKLQIDLLLNDKASGKLKSALGGIQKASKKTKMSFVELAAKVYVLQRAIMAATRVMAIFVNNASKVQQLNVRLKVLLGTVEKGNQLFSDMRQLASELPFEFDQIMESATNLAAVVEDGVREVNQLMPIIADLAAATGISIRDTTSQMIRIYSAGAASADMFRERGVLAMLGFTAGVSVSAKDSIKQVISAWEDGNSKFRGATDELRKTWEGSVSVMKDAWFNFTAEVGRFITENPKILGAIEDITSALDFLTDKITEANEKNDARNTILGDWSRILDETNEKLQKAINLQILGINTEEVVIGLLQRKVEIMGIINRLQNLSNQITVSGTKKEIESEKRKDAAKKTAFQTTIKIGEESINLGKQIGAANKVTAGGMAIINTAEGITRAWKDYPWPFSAIVAGIVGAAGAVQIATIAATPLKEGGIVTRPTMALIGEAGPEAVIPLERGGGIIGDTNITINFMGNIDSNGESVESIMEEIGFATESGLREARGF